MHVRTRAPGSTPDDARAPACLCRRAACPPTRTCARIGSFVLARLRKRDGGGRGRAPCMPCVRGAGQGRGKGGARVGPRGQTFGVCRLCVQVHVRCDPSMYMSTNLTSFASRVGTPIRSRAGGWWGGVLAPGWRMSFPRGARMMDAWRITMTDWYRCRRQWMVSFFREPYSTAFIRAFGCNEDCNARPTVPRGATRHARILRWPFTPCPR